MYQRGVVVGGSFDAKLGYVDVCIFPEEHGDVGFSRGVVAEACET